MCAVVQDSVSDQDSSVNSAWLVVWPWASCETREGIPAPLLTGKPGRPARTGV